MRRRLSLLLPAALLAAAASAFVAAGRPLPVPASPQRIVSLSPSVTRMIISLGRSNRIKGITSFCPAVEGAAIIGGIVNPSLESIVALKPDLVILSADDAPVSPIEPLTGAGIPLLILPEARNFDSIALNYLTLGELLSASNAAESAIAGIRAELGSPRSARVRAIFVLSAQPLILASDATFISDILLHAGYRNVFQSGNPYPAIAAEHLRVLRPERIISTAPAAEVDAVTSRVGMHVPVSEVSPDIFCHYTPQDFIAAYRELIR